MAVGGNGHVRQQTRREWDDVATVEKDLNTCGT
jgi:hypothetical protein